MKLSLRNVALVLGTLVIAGFIPDTLSAQKPRTENITITTSKLSVVSPVLPSIEVSPTERTPFDVSNNDSRDLVPPTPLPPQPQALQPPTPQPSQPQAPEPPRPYESLELFIHLPPDAAKYQPLRVLFVLHGMGGRGAAFSQGLVAEADKHHWLLIAPTIPYTDYMNMTTLLAEDMRYTGMLADMMSHLSKKLGLKLRQHSLVFGFSRGAQLAHRFGLFYPERVESVAAISSGSFTLPSEYRDNNPKATPLKMPYGVSDLELYLGHVINYEDLKKVSFLIEVGENDNAPDDVPRQFDPYVGKTRVERARAFQSTLLSDGISARLIIFPGASHEMTNDMIRTALQFLRDEELRKKLND